MSGLKAARFPTQPDPYVTYSEILFAGHIMDQRDAIWKETHELRYNVSYTEEIERAPK